jgi:hypothetical protein
MKLSPILLVVSLAANAGLLAWYGSRQSRGHSAPVGVEATASSVTEPSAGAALPSVLGRDFLSVTPDQLREQLRGSDLPANLVDQLIRARIYASLEERRRARVSQALKTAPPWRLAALRSDRFSLLTPEQRKELRDLEIQARDETLRLLGPTQLDRDGLIAVKYGFVAPEKAVRLDALDRDYANLSTLAKEETRYLRTAVDKDRDKILRAEQDRDLAALLTPAERDAYELRVSETAQNRTFQGRMAALKPTEAEYRALFALQKAAEEKPATGGSGRIARRGPPGATMVQFSGGADLNEEEVKVVLGAERFADWRQAGAAHYQSLVRLAGTHQLPPETVKQVADVLTETSNASWRIAESTTMTAPEKKAAMAELAAGARAQVAGKLGDLTDSYLQSTRWFDGIGTGMAVQINGGMQAFRPVDATAGSARATPAVIGTGTLQIAPAAGR